MSETVELTERQRAILSFIAGHVRHKGYAPSMTDIMESTGLESKSTVHHHLKQLRRKGLVDWVDGENRTLHVVLPEGLEQ